MRVVRLDPWTTGHGLPAASFGEGQPLVALPGLSAHHRTPGRFELSAVPDRRALARRYRVHVLQRRPGLAAGTTMADLAADVAAAIDELGAGPVPVVGMSTGGSIALQVALDRPDVVSRLVLCAAAARLGDGGRRRQLRLADLTRADRPRAAWAQLAPSLAATPPGRAAMAALLWLGGGPTGADATDLLAVIAAEDAFDAGPRLAEVRAPTLVVGGGRDGFYGPELFHDTAAGIPGGRVLLVPGSSHTSLLGHRPVRRAIVDFLAGEEWR